MDEQDKAKSPYLGIIIFLVIFAGLSIGVTIFLAKNNSNTINDNPNQNQGNITSDDVINYLGIKNYTDFYYTNNIEIVQKIYTEGEPLISQYEGEYYPLKINYIEINGLKNKSVEDKINKEIKELAFNLGNDELNAYQSYRWVNYNINGNFANILSFMLENHNYKKIYLNYDLTTGNQIKFEEIFTEDANVKEIVQNSLYDTLNNPYEAYDETAFELMYKFSKNAYDFSINNENIRMFFHDAWYENEILISKYYKNIAIFNRFQTDECIFENENVKKVEYGFASYENFYYVKDNVLIYLIDEGEKYSEIFENYSFKNKIYHISTDKKVLSNEEVKTNNIIDIVQNKVLNIIEYSKNTPDTMYVLGVNLNSNYNIYIFQLESEKESFYNDLERKLKDKLKETSFLYVYRSDDNTINGFDYISYGECYVNESGEFEYYSDKFPNSSKEIITEKDMQYYYYEEFYNIAYNEIFARHGHDFANEGLKARFMGELWYLPTYGKKVSLEELNDIEKQNISIIKEKIEIIKKYPEGLFEFDEETNTVDLGYDWEKYQFSYSDDENKIGEIYNPVDRTLIYSEARADSIISTTKAYFKGKYLHIIKKDTGEIYQTIEISETEHIINITDKLITGEEYIILEEYSYISESSYNNFLEIEIGCVDEVQYQDEHITVSPTPTRIENDVYGNKYAYYDLQNLNKGETLNVTIKRKVKCSEYKTEIPTSTNTEILEGFDKYLKPQERIDSEYEKIVLKAEELTKGLESDYEKAKAIFEFVNINMETVPNVNQGSIYAIENMRGSSEESATLFVAMCRAVNIPSRAVEGYHIKADNTLVYLDWAEIYLKDFGWVPVNTSEIYLANGKKVANYDVFCKTSNSNYIIRNIYYSEKGVRAMRGINEVFSSISLCNN